MSFKTLYQCLMLAGLTAFGASANAATFALAASNVAASPTPYSYNVVFNIDSGLLGSLTGQVDSTYRQSNGNIVTGFDITGVTLSSGVLAANETLFTTPLTPTRSTIANSWVFSASNLAAGTYTLTLTGKSYSATAGFTGGFNVVTSPVPEPETNALMMLGLGLVGLIARRKFA